RDLKPANIKITADEQVKVLDFGVAKIRNDDVLPPSMLTDMTATGAILGTAAYMSPEQASGLKVDARSDVFSFGVVLYELLTGRRPFEGNTDVDCLHAIIHDQAPPLAKLCPEIPIGLQVAVGKSLEKNPAERYQSMRDLVAHLRRLSPDTSQDSLRLV